MAWTESVAGGWRARWRNGGRGAPLLASPVFPTEQKAQDFADDMTARIAATRVLAASKRQGSPLELPELFARHVAARVAARAVNQELANHRAGELRAMAKRMGWATVADVSPAEVERWRTENGGRYGRLGGYLAAVLRWARDRLEQPVHPGALIALRPPRGRRGQARDLVSAKLVATWQSRADAIGASAGALVHCLATYGWRPVMATRLVVGDVDLARARIRHRAQSAGDDDYTHPLLPGTLKRLRPLCARRAAGDALFVDPRSSKPWAAGATSAPITDWWRVHVEPGKVPGRGVYELKRFAISGMLVRGMAPQDVALFTGHRTLSQVLTYARTSEDRARSVLDRLAPAAARKPARRRGARQSTEEHGGASGRVLAGPGSA